MKRTFRLIIIAIASVLWLSACSGRPERNEYISRDAVAVVKVNSMQLGKKIAWEKLANGSLFRERDTAFDIEKAGIDILDVFYAYALPERRLEGRMKWVLIIPLKDTSKWASFIKEKLKGAAVKEEKNLNIIVAEAAAAGWNKHTAIIAFDPGHTGSAGSAALLEDEVKKAFAITKEQSISTNEKFKALEKQSHDVSLFLNYELLMENLPQEQIGMAGGIVASQRKYLKDTYLSAGIDFEKGKIIAEGQYFTNPATLAVAKSLLPAKTDDEMLKLVPSGQLNALFSYHFNPKGLQSLIDTLGYTGLVNSQLAEANLSVEEIMNAFTGDFLFTVANLRMENRTATYSLGDEVTTQTYAAPHADWLLSIKIKDQAAVNKLLLLMLQMELFTKKMADVYESNGVILSVKNGYAGLSNNENTLNAFLNNTAPNTWKIPREITDNPAGFYVDVAGSAKAIPADNTGSPEKAVLMEEGKNMLEDIRAYGGKQKEDHLDFRFELNFRNKQENSLNQIIDFVEKVKKAEKSGQRPAPAI